MMAVDLQNSELLLPSQFLYDEEDILPPILEPSHLHKESGSYKHWEDHPHGTESAFSSPVDSEFGSAETESDKDDDYIGELTRQMAHYMLQDDHEDSLLFTEKVEKTWGLAGSPQSTLWSPLGSKYGTPDGSSQEPSPPPTPVFETDPFWDCRCDAADRLDQKKDLNDSKTTEYQHGQDLLSTASKSNVGLNSNQPLTDDQLRAIYFHRLKQERVVKQQASANWGKPAEASELSEPREQYQQHPKKGRFSNGGRARTNPWTQAQPQAQSHQQVGSGTRMFSRGSDSGSGSCGTGVFLPRGIWYSSESRKKPGCSTVFIPARVVQALQLHFDQMGAPSRTNACGFPLQNGGNGSNTKQIKRQSRKVPAMSQREMGLPQEWTY